MQIPLLVQITLTFVLFTSAAPHRDSRIKARDGLVHPHPRDTFRLFHGTPDASTLVLPNSVDLSRAMPTGDFHHVSEVPRGFYMTDSIVAAAQFACFGDPEEEEAPDSVEVIGGFKIILSSIMALIPAPRISVDWNWGLTILLSCTVDTTNPAQPAVAAILQNNVMIAGPMNLAEDVDLTNFFQQYAVIDQATANSPALVFQARHRNILCQSVPFAQALSDVIYEQGQGGNPGFTALLQTLQTPNPDVASDTPVYGCNRLRKIQIIMLHNPEVNVRKEHSLG
ncbi:hypothetical protein C8J57DRAFT_1230900 [Mycena rebaudengoi]|nr:hypothetical protein C8J57DRAFT_1230900 [Mycena rebaudengoi]